MPLNPRVGLIMATRDGLASWKTTLRVLTEAKSRNIEVAVAVDHRSTDGTAEAVRPLADHFIDFHNDVPYCEDVLDELKSTLRAPWCFLVSDDEWPSSQLWKFASEACFKKQLIYRPRMAAPLPDWSGHYRPLLTAQPRVFPTDSIRWPKGGIDILPLRALPERNIPEVLWHFNLWAPRASREEKVLAHEEAWKKNWDAHPWPAGSRRAYLWEDYPDEISPLEDMEEYR